MITFQRILFPVDFSTRSAAVVPSVQAMVKRFGSELTVLHVIDLPPAGIAPPKAAAWATLIGADRLRQQGKTVLEDFIAREFQSVPVKAELAEGDPAATIVDCVEEHHFDLIMMPTAGSGRFRSLLLGSVTAKVLHDTATPVWTGVHAEEFAAHPPDRWKRMLCALSDESRDLTALRWSAEFACEQKLELRLVHAVQGPEECENNPSFRNFLLDLGRERIAKLQAEAETKFEVCLKVGDIGQVIHEAATGHSTDIVVIGRGVIQKPLGLLRSGAYQIIRKAPCPVISV